MGTIVLKDGKKLNMGQTKRELEKFPSVVNDSNGECFPTTPKMININKMSCQGRIYNWKSPSHKDDTFWGWILEDDK